MIEINHELFFFANIVVTLLICLSCFKIAYIWKKRKLLFINFFSLGMTYSLVFIFLALWAQTHSLFTLITGNVLLFAWIMLFSVGTFIMIFPKKSPFDYAPLIYILIPFIYLFTRSVEMTFILALDLSGTILILNFIKLILFGNKLIKIASTFGIMMLLVRIVYDFTVSIQLNTPIYAVPIYTFILNILLASFFVSFLYISKNKPYYFLKSYELQRNNN